MILLNHGLLTTGRNISRAVTTMTMLIRSLTRDFA